MEINWNVNLSSKFKKENLMNFILVLLVIIWGWTPSHWSRPSGGLLNVINMNLALNSLHQHITLQTGDEFVILPGLLQYCVSHKDYHSGVPHTSGQTQIDGSIHIPDAGLNISDGLKPQFFNAHSTCLVVSMHVCFVKSHDFCS